MLWPKKTNILYFQTFLEKQKIFSYFIRLIEHYTKIGGKQYTTLFEFLSKTTELGLSCRSFCFAIIKQRLVILKQKWWQRFD
jgi:hypothetical protein